MGDLVLLSSLKTPARRIVVGESAAILFFTGVRYHRFADTADLPVPTASKRRRPARSKKANLVELHA